MKLVQNEDFTSELILRVAFPAMGSSGAGPRCLIGCSAGDPGADRRWNHPVDLATLSETEASFPTCPLFPCLGEKKGFTYRFILCTLKGEQLGVGLITHLGMDSGSL